MFNWVFQKEYRQKNGKNLIKEIKWEEGDVLSWDQRNVKKKKKICQFLQVHLKPENIINQPSIECVSSCI